MVKKINMKIMINIQEKLCYINSIYIKKKYKKKE